MFHIALYQPEIPPNTGNIIRLCANTGAQLHIIHPAGFSLDDKQLRRAGLDYHEYASLREHVDYAGFLDSMESNRIFALSTKGTCIYSETRFQEGDIFLFGPETRGLPAALRETLPAEHVLYVPMQTGSRSLNLANTAAIVLYEALRQTDFKSLR